MMTGMLALDWHDARLAGCLADSADRLAALTGWRR
jgi:hypothetical protein